MRDTLLKHTSTEWTMTDDFLTQRLRHPESIPSCPATQRIFWDCLSKAEHTFGPREAGWAYAVRRRQSPPYPETINDGQSHLTVWLTMGRSWDGYYFEAAHEAVHCLNPTVPSGSAMYIEEAIADEFSLVVVRRIFGQWGVDRCARNPDYRHARELASEIDEDMIRLGQRLRDHAGALGRVTIEAFKELYPDALQWAILGSLNRFPRQ